MKLVTFLFMALPVFLPLQQPFTRFEYCREMPGSDYEQQCLDMKPDGTGQSRSKRKGAQEPPVAFTLSPSGRDKFLTVIAGTRNLADRQKYESKRRVANLGHKHIILEMASEKREADFNYSDLKEVNALTTFFDGLINQQTFIQELEAAAQYERLSIPERLDRLETDLKLGRMGDPPGLISALDKLIANDRILDYARQHAQQMKSQILVAK
jgi:hypothetical protein